MTSEQEIKKIFNYSQENYLDIKLNKIDMQYSLYIERLLINFMNKVFEMEQNKKKKNYANFMFNLVDKYYHKS